MEDQMKSSRDDLPLTPRTRLSRMSRQGVFPAVALAAAALASPSPASAQLVERAGYVVVQRGDTLAIEQVVTMGRETAVELVLPRQGIRWKFTLERTTDERVSSMESTVHMLAAHQGAPPVQAMSIRFTADTVVAAAMGLEQRFPSREGAVPFVNLSAGSLQQLARRARAIGGARVELPVFILTGGQTMQAVVENHGDSSIIELAGVRAHVSLDASGVMTGGAVPSQEVQFIRVDGELDLGRPAPDYSAPPDAVYSAEDVSFRTEGGIRLAGTLTVPRERPAAGAPAAILISGSGPQDRDSEIAIVPGYRPFRQIADTLGRRGIAVLRLDDRGIGGSDPGAARATSADLAEDVRAAVAWLRARPDIDAARIALVGHSEGGLIAPMVAESDRTIAAIVLMAGPAQTGRQILAHQQRFAVEQDTTLDASKRDSVLAALWRQTEQIARQDPWIAFFLDHDPLATAMNVAAPVLILHGETDRQVTVEQAYALDQAFRAGGNARVTLVVFPGTNHLFLHDTDGGWGGYSALRDSSVKGEVLGSLADWLHETLTGLTDASRGK
jgi:uncharacterized protein